MNDYRVRSDGAVVERLRSDGIDPARFATRPATAA
jgi:hypothetical protein